jgi:uncharacterized protein involved in response to NO
MPGFATDLGHGDPGLSYSMLLAADAGGAFLAGVLLESGGLLPPRQRTAIALAMAWCIALAGFSLSWSYPLALALLFAAGFFELSFNAMALSLVRSARRRETAGASSVCSAWRASACARSAASRSDCSAA